jgi:N-acetylglucosaminyldiphosphoundecaprenol N-acetyl-beta-D-mannosaminyltransferase
LTSERFTENVNRRVRIMDLEVDRVSEVQAVAAAMAGVREGRGGWICPANLDVLRQVTLEPAVRELVRSADIVVADGMPLVWASHLQREPLPERVSGSSLIETLPRAAAEAGASVFLLGGDEGVADEAARRLAARLEGLRVAGTYCPPFGFEQSLEQLDAIDAALSAAQPDIVFVALGFPKQERLIARLRPLLPQAWFVSVGISLSLVSGDVARAPRWARRLGLEWVHRLAQEPRRLARRYLVDGIPFLARVLAVAMRRRVRIG